MSYNVCIDDFTRNDWETAAAGFSDYSIYQTWPYQDHRAETDGQHLSRAIVIDGYGHVVAMCQIRIKHLFPLPVKIGYVQWGPLMQSHDDQITCTSEVLAALKKAYVPDMVDILRLIPAVWSAQDDSNVPDMLSDAGFVHVRKHRPYQTLLVKVDDSEDEIRKRLHKSFRRDVKNAEKAGVEVRVGWNEEFFNVLEHIHTDLVNTKGFDGCSVTEFIRPQLDLSDHEKMKVIAVYHNGEPASAILVTNLGNRAIVLLAATNDLGRSVFSSYAAWYHAACLANQTGMKWCDLGGIDKKNNPKVFEFKSRMGGSSVSYPGAFDSSKKLSPKLLWQATQSAANLFKKRK